jgi:2-keto-4-pentenoate hydratase
MHHHGWIAGLLKAGRSGVATHIHPSQLQCSLPEAYALQALHLRQVLDQAGDSVIGTKLSVTSAAALERLGLQAPLLGPILRRRSHASGVTLQRADFLACILEAEIGVRLRADLDGSRGVPSREALLDAIDCLFPAIEIADSRYAQWAEAPACAIVADLAYAGSWVRGADCADWRRIDLRSLPVTLSRKGDEIRSGSGAAVLGDPLHALALAVADSASRGQVLRAGDVISTGACTAPWPVPGGGCFTADFGRLGQVELTLA